MRLPQFFKREEIKHRITIDINELPPCIAKVIEEWSWREAKNIKYLVHFDGKYFVKERLGENRK